MEGEGGQVKEGNPSSAALTSTVMVDGVLYRFNLRSSESTITGSKAPKSSHYVDLSEYPPGTDIEYELHWDGSRVVSKVPRWAHEKWLRKYQNDPPEDTSPSETTSRDAAAAAADDISGKRPCEDHPNSALGTAAALRPHIREALASRLKRMVSEFGPERLASPRLAWLLNQGGERPCEDHLNSASATASSGKHSFGTKALKKRPHEDLVEKPSPTAAAAAADGAKAEVSGLNSSAASGFPFSYPYAYADPSASASDDYPGKYAYSVEDDGRVVLKVDECVAPLIKIGGINPSKVIRGGVYYTHKVPEIVVVDEHTGDLVYLQKS